MVNQLHYPTWTARTNDPATPVAVRTALPEGLLEVQVPPGVQNVWVEIPLSRAEHAGRWVSLICLLICVVLTLRPRDLGLSGNDPSKFLIGLLKPL